MSISSIQKNSLAFGVSEKQDMPWYGKKSYVYPLTSIVGGTLLGISQTHEKLNGAVRDVFQKANLKTLAKNSGKGVLAMAIPLAFATLLQSIALKGINLKGKETPQE